MSAQPPQVPPPSDPLAGATVVLTALNGPPYHLKVVEAHDAALVGRDFRLTKGGVLGRSEEADVVLPDASVSRKHARVEWTGVAWRLLDLKSANGTWVGDRRVEGMPLDELDRFRVGSVVLEFTTENLDATALDLDVSAVLPARAMVESLKLQLGAPLEQEGEEVVVSANRPFFLDDPRSAWLVLSGRIDVFAVPVKGGEAAGARTHFVSVEAGQALFGMDQEGFGFGSGFLASGRSGTRLRRIAVARLAEVAAAGRQTARIAALVDGWVAALGRALVRDLPPQAVGVDLEPGSEAALLFGQRARARRDVVWVNGGGLLFAGLSEVAGDGLLFPVGTDAWVEAPPDGVRLRPARSVELLGEAAFWRGLAAFHQVLCECEFLNKKLATVDEVNRLRSKAEHAEAARRAALREIGDVLAGAERKGEAADATDAEPLFQACRLVCAALGMEARKPPEARGERSFEDTLYAVAVASRFRTRSVALKGDWWRRDQGPMLARLEEGGEPVALLPASPKAYDAVTPRTGRRVRVDAALAATLHPFATAFYRRFPDGLLTAKEVFRFGLHGMRSDVGWLIGMGLALGLLGAMTPYFTGKIFDSAIPQAERSHLAQFAIALVVAAVASTAFRVTQSVAVLRVEGRMDYAIQAALWDRLLDLPSNFFRRYAAGDLADRAGGIDHIRHLVAGAGVGAVLGVLSSVFYLVLMLRYDVRLALLGVGLTLLFVGASTTANVLQLRYQREQLDISGRITGLVLQLISGVGKLRVAGAEHHGFRVWAREFAGQKRFAMRSGVIQSAFGVFNASFPILSSMAVFGLLVSAPPGRGGTAITTGEFIAFSAAFGMFLGAVQSLSEASLSMLVVVPVWERLSPILTTPAESDESKAPPGSLRGEIEIAHVSFRYGPDAPFVLRDLSLKIRPGEFVAFVGSSGCGKSTLMRLMLGFETPETGTVYYDGQDLATLDLRLVRQQLGVVLQESRVLPADIYRNIAGSTSKTIDDAWEAAEAAGLADDIRAMPMGMHTWVAEGGGGFSGGQKQRLMIARAVVGKPKILFLDEATSALDNRTQAIVTASMDRMRATRVVIAHRLSTIVNADRICYLEEGRIVEQGTYDELMRKEGRFAALARRQMA